MVQTYPRPIFPSALSYQLLTTQTPDPRPLLATLNLYPVKFTIVIAKRISLGLNGEPTFPFIFELTIAIMIMAGAPGKSADGIGRQ